MLEKNVALVESAFKEYYFNQFDYVHVPVRANEREFGYQKINGGMTRHLTIKNDKDLHLLLMKEIPSDVYCSNAYYSFPNLSMAEKDWKGADLIFDIDAKDLALPCRKDHTIYKCSSCQNVGIGEQAKCSLCNSIKLESVSVVCNNCISESKKEVKKLLDILTSDLAVKKEEIHVYFSGNEGFHIRITNNAYESLGSQERADLVDYIMLNGIMPETLGIKRQNNSKTLLPTKNENGWRGRIAQNLFTTKAKNSRFTKQIISEGYQSFQLRLEEIKHTLGVKIDPKVTMDIHRIFRLEGSINSKSGLSKIQCSNLDSFNPFSEACLLSEDEVQIISNCPASIKLKNKKYGPYNNETVILPKYAAVYLVCKGLGNMV